MPVRMIVEGLDEIIRKFRRFPKQLDGAMSETLKASLIELQGSVLPYPPQNPDSDYVRTGTLGRTLGASMTGRPEGKPDIFEVQKEGGKRWVGHFGTRLNYAEPVIGEKQARVHQGRWWTIRTVAKRARPKIERRFRQMAEALARWLDR
jgi:hypothetical protein